jgi:L,D-peptidoglycan transpeptidase YkuD (ErfK/YbiS/YcfS/YnhG family)
VFKETEVSIGSNGFVNPKSKIEGDFKTPHGVYYLGAAFGYEKNVDSKMDFIILEPNTYWITDSKSKLYNSIVNFIPPDAKKYEKMRRLDHLHKYGLIIKYNMDPPIPKKGSAITIHVERYKGFSTAGCIAVNEDRLKDMIVWLDPKKEPQIIMGDYDWLLSLL